MRETKTVLGPSTRSHLVPAHLELGACVREDLLALRALVLLELPQLAVHLQRGAWPP